MALILSRKLHETVVVTFGETTLTITVAEIDRGKIRLAFAAPKSVDIVRLELLSPAERAKAMAGAGAQ